MPKNIKKTLDFYKEYDNDSQKGDIHHKEEISKHETEKQISPGKKIIILEHKVIKSVSKSLHDSMNSSDSDDSEYEIFSKPKRLKTTRAKISNGNKSGTLFVSPSTNHTYTNLDNVIFSPLTSPAQEKNTKSPSVSSLGGYCNVSRCSSLNDISSDKLLQINLPLDDEKICQYINTPSGRKKRYNECLANAASMKKQLEIDITENPEIFTSAEIHNRPKVQLLPSKSQTLTDKTVDHRQFQYSLDVIHEYGKRVENNKIENINDKNVIEDNSINRDDLDSNNEQEDSLSYDSSGSLTCNSLLSNESSSDYDTQNENEIVQDEGDELEWKDISEEVPNINEFIGECTINVSIDSKTPFEIYKLFLTDEIIIKMVEETNKYATSYININNLKPKSRLNLWKDTNYAEMLKFLGIMIVMGLSKVPHINDYWSKKPIYRNEYICSIMKRDRFLLLLRCWHFSNNDSNANMDKLHKIRDIYVRLLKNFNTTLTPGKYLVIDETMIPWRGRLKFRQYIKNKSHRYGIKLYKLCTPEGYTNDVMIYTGKGDNGREINHAQQTILKLIDKLKDQGRIVICDNFYTSIGLAEELLSRKTFLCGTIRTNRKGLPRALLMTRLKKGQICGKMNNKGVRIIKWVDKRPVTMISTINNHNTEIIDTGRKRWGSGENIKKPRCILMYNATKKGIDYSDQMSSYYTTLKRGIKWYRKVIMELIFGTAIVNAWIVYNKGRSKSIPKKQFMEAIIESLTGVAISAGKN